MQQSLEIVHASKRAILCGDLGPRRIGSVVVVIELRLNGVSRLAITSKCSFTFAHLAAHTRVKTRRGMR